MWGRLCALVATTTLRAASIGGRFTATPMGLPTAR